MGCPNDGSFKRTVTGNHADYNVYALTTPPPTMRHSWNPDNTLEQWRARFGEDAHSRAMPIAFELKGTSFRLLGTEGLDAACPLPSKLGWQPAGPGRAGCSRTRWP